MEACDLNYQKNGINLSRPDRTQTNRKQIFVGKRPKPELGHTMGKQGRAAEVI